MSVFDFDISDIWINVSDFEYPYNHININPLKCKENGKK